MKLLDTVAISGATGFLIIGVLQAKDHGFYNAYWAFMLMIALAFFYLWRNGKRIQEEHSKEHERKEAARKKRLKQNPPKKRKKRRK